jgi:hypothetical protein
MGIKCPNCQHENPDDTLYCGKCGIPLKHPEDISVTKTLETPVEQLAPGSIFANRYEIIEELGKGEMRDENTIELFRNELKIARKASHKNVCRMDYIGREDARKRVGGLKD